MSKVLLAVDLSYQSYRASAANPHLTSGRYFTGGVYGFFTSLAKTIRETQATRLVICSDRKPYRRSLDYPDYKRLRAANADDSLLAMHKQTIRLLGEAFEALGIPVWGLDGFESDDLIAHCVHRYRGRYARIYAASNDSDLYQLFWADNFAVYRDSITNCIDRQVLRKTLGLEPAEYMLVTALTGTHNDIAGIPRVGPKTAYSAIKDPARMRALRDGWAQVIDRNLKLIRLPHRDFPGEASLPAALSAYDRRAFIRWCARYDIEVTGSMSSALDQVLT